MFQIMNFTKFAPFTLLAIYQKSMYPPKHSKIPPFWQITQNLPTIFRLDQRKWKLKISQQIARNSLNSPITMVNHAKSTPFSLNPTTACSLQVYPTFLQQILQNSPNSLILRANHTKLTNFALISINLLFYF